MSLGKGIYCARPRLRTGSWVGPAAETCEVRILPAAVVSVDAFGADPTGKTSSTAAIEAALAAAGDGGTVIFTAGARYLNTGPILASYANQTWLGNGATLKRMDAISTTTKSPISTTSQGTLVEVADASKFRVGMSVTVFQESRVDKYNHRILAIDGNTLTLGTRFGEAFSSGATLTTSFEQVSVAQNVGQPTGLTIEGLKFDGNRAGNTLISRWELHSEVRVSADGLTLRNLTAVNAQAEGFMIGGQGVTLEGLTVVNSNGNGIHFSGIRNYTATGLIVQNANLLGTLPGHADGGVIWSNDTEYGVLDGIYVENAIAGLGSIDSPDNSNLLIRNVTVINCDKILDMKVPGIGVSNVTIENLVSRNDYSVALIEISNSQGLQSDAGPSGIRLVNWHSENARLKVRGARDVEIVNSKFKVRLPDANAVTNVEVSERVRIDALVQGGRYGIVTSLGCSDIVFQGIATNNAWTGIYFSDGTRIIADNARVIANIGMVDNGRYIGAVLGQGTQYKGGKLDLLTGTVGIVMPTGTPGVANSGAIVDGVNIRNPTSIPSIRIYNGSVGNVIKNSRTTTPIFIPANSQTIAFNNSLHV